MSPSVDEFESMTSKISKPLSMGVQKSPGAVGSEAPSSPQSNMFASLAVLATKANDFFIKNDSVIRKIEETKGK